MKGFLISKGATNTLDFFSSTGSGAVKLTALKVADDQDCYTFAYKHQNILGWLGLLQAYVLGTGLGDGLFMGPECSNWSWALGGLDIVGDLYSGSFKYGINSWGDCPIASTSVLPASISCSGLAPIATDTNGISLGGFLGTAPYGINGDGTNRTVTNTQMLVTPTGNDLKGNAFSGYSNTYKVTNTKWTNAVNSATYSTGVNDNPVGHIDAFLQAALQWAFVTTGTAANISLLKFINKKANTGTNLTNTAAFNLLKSMILAYDPDLFVWAFINLGKDDVDTINTTKAFSMTFSNTLAANTNPFPTTGSFINHTIEAGWSEDTNDVTPFVVINNVIKQPSLSAWSNNLTNYSPWTLSSLPQFQVPFYSYLYPHLQRYKAYNFSSTARFSSILNTYPNYKLPPTWSSTANFGGLFPTNIKTFGQVTVQTSNPVGANTVNYGTMSTTVFGNPGQLNINGATPTTTYSINTLGSVVSKPPGSCYTTSYLNAANYGGDFNIFD